MACRREYPLGFRDGAQLPRAYFATLGLGIQLRRVSWRELYHTSEPILWDTFSGLSAESEHAFRARARYTLKGTSSNARLHRQVGEQIAAISVPCGQKSGNHPQDNHK